MRQSTNATGTIILGVLAGGVFLLGLLAFLFVMTSGPSSEGGGLFAKAPVESTIDPALPKLMPRDYAAAPLSLDEKAAFAPQIAGALGRLDGGWQLRPFELGDLVVLRSDLVHCTSMVSGGQSDCNFVRLRDTEGLWTYAREDARIAVAVTYRRSRTEYPRHKIELSPKIGGAQADIFRKGVPSDAWRDAGVRAGFALRKLPAEVSDGAQVPGLYRYMGSLEGDGEVRIHIASNTDRETTLSVLPGLDHAFLKAIVADPVLSQDGANAQIASREVEFDVLSEEALRLKVAEMSAKQRNGYVKGIMKDALSKGLSPEDYAITYFAPGPEGQADTIAFLTGDMSTSHPGYKVLTQEYRRSLPVGTCLQTPHDTYCGKKAEYLRIAHEIRRLNHARADLPSE